MTKPNLTHRLARIGMCVAVALPVLASAANAEMSDTRTPFSAPATGAALQTRAAFTTGTQLYQNTSTAPGTVNGAGAAAQPQAVNSAALQCLSEALYFEARGEGVAGQKAVAEVILNRVESGRFPGSVCGVVNQSGQFSYKGRGYKARNAAAMARSRAIAAAALAGAPRDLTGGATYFHTTAVRPAWSNRFVRTTRIGSHVFYRQGGGQRLASN